jgi:uncharacterized membrane protein YgcG
MKKYVLSTLIFLTTLFVTPLSAQELTTEHIEEFKSDITVNQDATIDITEEIHYYFDKYKHGIYWQYPIEYNSSGFKSVTSFDLNNLYYYPENNPNAKKTVYEKSTSNDWIELQIGDPDRTIKGNYVYVIDYTIQDAGISYFDDHDEAYINVIGPGWQVPILQATANITSFTQPTEKICYTGPEGSTSQECKFEESDNGYTLRTTSVLQPYDSLTFAYKYPTGSIEDRTTQIWIGMIISNLGILLPVPIILLLSSLLKKKWSNKKITIIPHYEVPDDLDPLIGGYVYESKQDFKHISATLIWMATKGYLSIEKEGKNLFIQKKVEDLKSEVSHIEELFNALFNKEDRVNIKKMPSSFTKKIQSILFTVKSNSSKYIDEGRVGTKNLLLSFGIVAGFLGFLFLTPFLATYGAIGTGIGIGISGIVSAIIAGKIDIRSKKGNELYYELEGLKMYINTAEKHRIEFHNDPEKFRGVFEKLLPYAMIFGLEKKWAKEFEDLYKDTQPNWYRGDFDVFDVYMFTMVTNSLNRSVKSATTKAYGSNSGLRTSGWSSGGSGFSGGSAGGGGGGSGGGSW